MKNFFGLVLGVLFFANCVNAQEENSLIRKGNEKFVQKKYEEAQVNYLAALDINSDSYKARFNLADAYYMQKKYDNALKELSFLANNEKDKIRLASVYHNIGNCYFKMGKLNEAEDAYKKALRNNPTDMDTKFNLAFVKRNKNQGGNGGSKNKDDKKKDEKKDKKDQQKDNQQKDKQDQKPKPQPQQNKLSKEDADRMLDAMQQDEKKTLEKMKEQPKAKARSVKIEKAW